MELETPDQTKEQCVENVANSEDQIDSGSNAPRQLIDNITKGELTDIQQHVEEKMKESDGVITVIKDKQIDIKEIVSEDAKDKSLVDGDQFTEPEILDLSVLDQPQKLVEDSSECGDETAKSEWIGKQQVEPVLNSSSSSDEESRGGSEKTNTLKRRKKRPRQISQASIDRHKKMQQIHDVLSSSPLDIDKLRELAVGDGGLVKDELRRKAWPRLMMIEHMEVTPKPTLDVVKAHKDYQQVVLDVNRSLKRFPPGIDDDYRLVLMDQLTTLIIRVLIKHPDLHYYQGFHDVAITFLLVMGEDVGFEMVEKLAVTHLCDFMRPTMEKTTYYLTYLYPILKRADPKLHQFLIDSGVGTVFCLPWLITWFAHTLSDYRNVVRLYDFFLATPYLMPMYIASAIVLKKKEDILTGECEMAMQHFILSQVPDTLPFEEILIRANELHDAYPPDTMQDEVDEFIKKKNEEEALEKQRLLEKKKKFEASRRGRKYREILYAVSRYNPIPPAQTKMIFKVAFFAVTAYFATSLYSYYSESPSLFPFFTRQ